jgi:hypothetical protein
MTVKTALENCRRAAAHLRGFAHNATTYLDRLALIEEAAAVEQLAATWRPPGEEAQMAVEVQALARRQLAAMATPGQHVAEHAVRGIVKRGRAS